MHTDSYIIYKFEQTYINPIHATTSNAGDNGTLVLT
jgi:hypothetical protein